ncbi:TPA: glycine cleavage system protein GcvH [Staphylococcus aureus]|nr:glycine cleavage system protein GcvH [Staphylococcus aureus]HDF0394714.1 glycine cleavage system protein GcvH [Staphylococcus aureus]HDF0494626.1 glycine cleavage system protein GcvH [Staphylococcus aureus]HDF3476255.1 glycine cleavage system protein GcvH [Staphylococcus aureus]HDF4411881.1 glycine cleavage system protein GcvH [Staphylococcus aureus]
MAVPNELKYSKEHEWVKVEGNVATIGITEYAQSELGDIVFVELPETDDEINEGDTFGSVESVKTVSELYAPISGKVVEVNEELEDSPEFVNESPYEKAWMVKVEVSDESQLEALLSAEKYAEMIGEYSPCNSLI